jgi:hypothetical protein
MYCAWFAVRCAVQCCAMFSSFSGLSFSHGRGVASPAALRDRSRTPRVNHHTPRHESRYRSATQGHCERCAGGALLTASCLVLPAVARAAGAWRGCHRAPEVGAPCPPRVTPLRVRPARARIRCRQVKWCRNRGENTKTSRRSSMRSGGDPLAPRSHQGLQPRLGTHFHAHCFASGACAAQEPPQRAPAAAQPGMRCSSRIHARPAGLQPPREGSAHSRRGMGPSHS